MCPFFVQFFVLQFFKMSFFPSSRSRFCISLQVGMGDAQWKYKISTDKKKGYSNKHKFWLTFLVDSFLISVNLLYFIESVRLTFKLANYIYPNVRFSGDSLQRLIQLISCYCVAACTNSFVFLWYAQNCIAFTHFWIVEADCRGSCFFFWNIGCA